MYTNGSFFSSVAKQGRLQQIDASKNTARAIWLNLCLINIHSLSRRGQEVTLHSRHSADAFIQSSSGNSKALTQCESAEMRVLAKHPGLWLVTLHIRRASLILGKQQIWTSFIKAAMCFIFISFSLSLQPKSQNNVASNVCPQPQRHKHKFQMVILRILYEFVKVFFTKYGGKHSCSSHYRFKGPGLLPFRPHSTSQVDVDRWGHPSVMQCCTLWTLMLGAKYILFILLLTDFQGPDNIMISQASIRQKH